MKDELASIKGQPRIIPIFSDVVTPIIFRIGQALGFVASGGGCTSSAAVRMVS